MEPMESIRAVRPPGKMHDSTAVVVHAAMPRPCSALPGGALKHVNQIRLKRIERRTPSWPVISYSKTFMPAITLRSLHNCLRLLENASELKRRLPASSNLRTLREGLYETSRLAGVEEAVFKDPQTIAAMIGASRFVMIWGEPSVTDHVAHVFESSRILLNGLVSGVSFESAMPGRIGAGHQKGGAMAAASPGYPQLKSDPAAAVAQPKTESESSFEDLKALLSGNTALTCRLFRALFEQMLGVVLPPGVRPGNGSLVNELIGSKDHGRSFLSTALFILGAEIDRDNLMSFLMQQGLFGMPIFEHLLQNRDYCEACHSFRRLDRAFMGSPAAEEAQLRTRLDKFNAQFGGKPYGAKIFEATEQDKARIDAYQAAADLLEAMALTPWCLSLSNAVSLAASNSIRSTSVIARHFERFGRGEITKDQANQEISDHLLAFARQFSADTKPG